MAKSPTPIATVPAVAETTIVAGKVRVAPILTEVTSDVPMPTKRKRGGIASHYNFDVLTAVGQSFGIANKKAAQISAIVSKENRRHMSVTVDPTDPSKTVKTFSKKFEVFDVDPATDPAGATVRVFRTL